VILSPLEMERVPGRCLLMNERGRESTTYKGRVARQPDHEAKLATGWGRGRSGPHADLPPPVISTTTNHGTQQAITKVSPMLTMKAPGAATAASPISMHAPAAFVTAPAHCCFPSRTAPASRRTVPVAPQGPSARRR